MSKIIIKKSKLILTILLLLLLLLSLEISLVIGSEMTKLPIITFDEGYSHLFGGDNLIVLNDRKALHLSLDHRTGAGIMSHDVYLHGFFSASIKLPADYTAGVVVAFYMSNGDTYENNHDELDFEFLGNIRGKEWRVQTNVYGNGSTSIGREERFTLWFDPSDEVHQYSILWTQHQIIFYVDDIPIREIRNTKAMTRDFPSKPVSLYATIWDGSDWATNGGKYRVDYRYAPYVAEFSNLVLNGCSVDPTEAAVHRSSPDCHGSGLGFSWTNASVSSVQRAKMARFRRKHLTYSYCYDEIRYRVPPPECVVDPREKDRLRRFDPVTFGGSRRRRHGRRRHHRVMGKDKGGDDVASI